MSWKHHVTSFLMLYGFCSACSALGIDKLSGELDVAKGFKSVTSFTVFNDRDETIFVTSRGLTWDMDRMGQLTTAPSNDLEIFPPVVKVMAGDSAVFKIRYVGPLIEGEGHYRLMFSEVRIPRQGEANEKLADIQTLTPDVGIGMAITVPLYVSDFSKQEGTLEGVSASYSQSGKRLSLLVKNDGDHHINIRQHSINGVSMAGLGIVLPHRERLFVLDISANVSSVVLGIVYRDKTRNINAIRE